MRSTTIKIYFDGGCRPNPGQMETGVVALGVFYHRSACGIGSNNDAEWLALIHAAQIAFSIGVRDVVLLGDSAFVVAGASGKAKCTAKSSKGYFDRFQNLATDFERIRIRKIARTQNLAGIALAKARR